MSDIKRYQFIYGNSLDHYETWPSPVAIISDGAYGLSGFDGDPSSPDDLASWYEPHVVAWTKKSTAETTLWFWNSEIGWAMTHPIFDKYGWKYKGTHVWNKGISHIAGNVNSKTIRGFPVVTEICVKYTLESKFVLSDDSEISLQNYLRSEWIRTGLPMRLANEACGVKDAATRKYLIDSPLWYPPPEDKMLKMIEFANRLGDPKGKPYFSINGQSIASRWSQIRSKWNHEHGVTNVWDEPAVRGTERLKGDNFHTNQKPLRLMDLIVRASTDEKDVVWEPFGGLFSGSLAAIKANRIAYSCEVNRIHFDAGIKRIKANT